MGWGSRGSIKLFCVVQCMVPDFGATLTRRRVAVECVCEMEIRGRVNPLISGVCIVRVCVYVYMYWCVCLYVCDPHCVCVCLFRVLLYVTAEGREFIQITLYLYSTFHTRM